MSENTPQDQGQESTSPIVNVQASDNTRITTEEVIDIVVFQSEGLVACTRRLATLISHNKHEETCLATATVLTAVAALEALLSEFAYLTNRSAYTRRFRKAGIADKYRRLTGTNLESDHPSVFELLEHRNAITHSEPANPRSRHYGTRINEAGAIWVADTVEEFARALWGSGMPDWFRFDSGL